jgi:hypothetical protein
VSRLATSFVLGYHGCDKSTGMKALEGDLSLLQSNKSYDWLGPGVYFWESDPLRALEWAQWKKSRGECAQPFVIGAVIDLRHCLDLLAREDLEVLRSAYRSYASMRQMSGQALPRNIDPPGRPGSDKALRFLDCAVIKHLHSMIEDAGPAITPYDSVRGLFIEGDELFEGSGFKSRTHVQIAVKNTDCIKGLFIPRPYPAA